MGGLWHGTRRIRPGCCNGVLPRPWAVIDSPFARAHEYLSKIDLFGKDNEKGLKIDDLNFIAPGGSGYSDNCGVFSEDPITASLLQARPN